MNHEQHTGPRIWNPLGFFDDFKHSGLLIFSLAGLAVIAVAVFFTIIIRRRLTDFFALPLFLSLVPFVTCSLISYLRFYSILGSAPPGATVESGAHEIASIQYPFQFGILFSGALLLVHVCAYGFIRKTRNA